MCVRFRLSLLDSGLDKGQSPVERGNFLLIHPYPSLLPTVLASHLGLKTDGWMDEQKISSFYRTLSPIGAAVLPSPMKTKEKVEQGKGTIDHLMPLGYLFSAEFVTKIPQ